MSDYYFHTLSPMQVVSVKLKLFINTRSNTVVYAEAGKRFVDWLFQMLNLPAPLGTFVGMTVTGQLVNGSVGNLITSIQILINSRHILTNDARFFEPLHPPFIKLYDSCTSGHNVESDGPFGGPLCPDCRKNTLAKMSYVAPPSVKEGSYMVTDDLVVKPMPTARIATLPKRPGLPSLEERVVDVVIGEDEAVKLMHSVLVSKKVFTDVFILKGSPFCRPLKFLPARM